MEEVEGDGHTGHRTRIGIQDMEHGTRDGSAAGDVTWNGRRDGEWRIRDMKAELRGRRERKKGGRRREGKGLRNDVGTKGRGWRGHRTDDKERGRWQRVENGEWKTDDRGRENRNGTDD